MPELHEMIGMRAWLARTMGANGYGEGKVTRSLPRRCPAGQLEPDPADEGWVFVEWRNSTNGASGGWYRPSELVMRG